MNETRTVRLAWAFGFLTVYGTLADRRFLGAAAMAAVLAARDLAALSRRRRR